MPRKIRELIQDLRSAGFYEIPGGGKSAHRNFTHARWVEWSEEDQTCIGKCPDLITGIHGDDPVSLYSELCDVIDDVIRHLEAEGRSLPRPRIRPMQEVV